MNHFLDIHTTDPGDLRHMIDHARTMKDARFGQPKGTPDARTTAGKPHGRADL